MPPEGITAFNFQQSFSFQQSQPQQPHQVQHRQVRQALPSMTPTTCDSSTINNEDICEGGPLPGIGNRRHLFNINQLNHEHLRYLFRGLLRRWGYCVTLVLLRRLHLGPALIMHLFNHTTRNLPSLQQPINHSRLWLQRHLARAQQQQHQLPSAVLHLRRQSPIIGTTRRLWQQSLLAHQWQGFFHH